MYAVGVWCGCVVCVMWVWMCVCVWGGGGDEGGVSKLRVWDGVLYLNFLKLPSFI